MSLNENERIHAAFHKMLDVPQAQWEERLFDCCGGDVELVHAVRNLLAAHLEADATRRYDVEPGRPGAEESMIDLSSHGFRLGKSLGVGGMGRVWKAIQETPNRVVAIKVLRWGPLNGGATNRFLREIDVLGRIDHPNVCQIFEAGSADQGGETLPYFAMEYLDGAETIVEYSRKNGLDRKEILRLFIDACHGVQAGHDAGIVHRDVKPSNILVDNKGRLKVIDFGVARVIRENDERETLLTRSSQILGTLQYMSPEQCEGGSAAVGSPSDVYSLGVLLYELLCGTKPYDVIGIPLMEAIRIVRQESPDRPSSHTRSLRGDLETILEKTLNKDPDRRYRSAGDLAADIERYLRNEPIEAMPHSSTYKAMRFARRNRSTVVWSTAIAAILVLTTLGLNVLNMKRSQATRLQGHLANLLVEQVREANPVLNPTASHSPKLAHEVAELLASLDELGLDQPNRAVDLRLEIALTLEGAGLWEEARGNYLKVIELCSVMDASGSFNCDRARLGLASTNLKLGDYEQARVSLQRLTDRSDANQGSDHRIHTIATTLHARLEMQDFEVSDALKLAEDAQRSIQSMVNRNTDESASVERTLATTLGNAGRHADAIVILRDLLDRQQSSLDPDSPAVVLTTLKLGEYLDYAGQSEEAGRLLDDSVARLSRRLGDDHPDTLKARTSLASHLIRNSDTAESRKILVDVDSRSAATLGVKHPITIQAKLKLAHLAQLEGDATDEGEDLIGKLREVIDLCGEDNVILSLNARNMLGGRLVSLGRFDEAEDVMGEVWRLCHKHLGSDHPRVIESAQNQANLEAERGNFAGQLEILEENIDRADRVLGPDHQMTLNLRHSRALLIGPRLGRYQEGFKALRKVTSDSVESLGPTHVVSLNARRDLITAMTHMGQAEQAREGARQALEDSRRSFGDSAPLTLQLSSSNGFLLGKLGAYEESEALLKPAFLLSEKTLGPNHSITLDILGCRASNRLASGNFSDAAHDFKVLADRRSDLLGPGHIRTLTSRSNQARSSFEHGDHEEALSIYQTLLPLMLEHLPEEHPMTNRLKIDIGLILAGRSQFDAAEPLIVDGIRNLHRSMGDAPAFWDIVDEVRLNLDETPSFLEGLDMPSAAAPPIS